MTIVRYLKATQTAPEQYDAIVTGDLGIVGSELLCDLVMKQGFDITRNHKDCGAMLYDPETQDTHAGGSGCGCSASLLCGHFLPALQAGTMRADPVRRNRCAHVPHGIPAGRKHSRHLPPGGTHTDVPVGKCVTAVRFLYGRSIALSSGKNNTVGANMVRPELHRQAYGLPPPL